MMMRERISKKTGAKIRGELEREVAEEMGEREREKEGEYGWRE